MINSTLAKLPIDAHLAEIVATLDRAGALVLTAPPGAGKTTRLPRALLDSGLAADGEILALEPRRLAARLAAGRVAAEMGETPGGTVGYSIRFESAGGPQTRVRFLTEAVLTRRVVSDPALAGVSVVIIDEFHERHIATDLALALVRRAQKSNPRLRLLVMSATLDAAPIAAYLGGAPVIALAEQPHELSIEYEDKPDRRPLADRVRGGVLKLFREGVQGDILVFLPGAAEIRRAAEALRSDAAGGGFTIAFLHGDLGADEERRALEPAAQPKVILATNVAETSITIPSVAAVIDSGLARVAGYAPRSGRDTLTTAKISQSSATQRAGRAGRTRAGRVLRLYSRADYHARPRSDTPEILRSDLCETALLLHGAGITAPRDFDWFERPSAALLDAAEELLTRLGALAGDGRLTPTGRQMLTLPVHPRMARLIIEGDKLGIAAESRLAAALIAEKDIRLETRARLAASASRHATAATGSGRSDIGELIDRFREAEAAGFQPGRLRALELDAGAVSAVRQALRQLQRLRPATGARGVTEAQKPAPKEAAEVEEALGLALLSAFPDRVARRRRPREQEILLASGGSARLAQSSVVSEPLFLLAVDIADMAERKDAAGINAAGAWIRLASAIEIEWLAELCPEKLVETTELRWNEAAGRVEEARRTTYEAITLEESVRPARPSAATARVLIEALQARGIERLPGHEALTALRLRLELLGQTFPEENWPRASAAEIAATLEELCQNCRSLAEVEALSLADAFKSRLTEAQRVRLDRLAPERLALTPKRSVVIHYEAGQPPWIASRLQDFFGVKETPRICAGRVALTLHLLAPNQRAVQVTQDLGGFWSRHYPAIRRELMRRYPRHAWPEAVS